MEELALLFIGSFLDATSASGLRDETALKAVITTPLGTREGVSQSQLALILVPYISETARVGQMPMRRLYLEQTLDSLAVELGVDRSELLDGFREIVVVAGLDTPLSGDFVPCYYGTTGNPVNMENLQRLEANAVRCLSEGLEYLPADLLPKWKDTVLVPVFEQARAVICGEGTQQL